MILEAMYNGEFYPCETVVPTSPEYANSDHATVRVGKCNQVNGKGFRVNPRALAVKERRFHRTTYLFNRHFAAHARTPSS